MLAIIYSARSRRVVGTLCAAAVLALVACTTSNNSSDGGVSCASPGAATPGPADTHCTVGGQPVVTVTSTAACYVDAAAGDDSATGNDGGTTGDAGDDGGSADAAAGDDGGGTADAGDIGNCGNDAYGPTMYGQQGGDDDCKYDVSWTSTPICEGQPVYFTVSATKRADHSPASGANIRPDVVLNCSHPIPNSPAPADPSPEDPPGTYKVGPVVFDQPGKWVVRFHLNENCFDISPNSPHGHAAFYVQVP